MGVISIIIPLVCMNLIPNPSFELGLAGWSGGGGVLSRVATDQYHGVYSGQLVTTPGQNYAGVIYGNANADQIPVKPSTQYTLSFRYKQTVGADTPMRIDAVDFDAAHAQGSTATGTFTSRVSDGWIQQTLTFTTAADAAYLGFSVTKANSANNITFLIDAAQLEAGDEATTYCDGDQPGSIWLGAPHASASERSAKSGFGGRLVDLAGDGAVLDVTGFGMPEVSLHNSDRPLGDGVLCTGYKVLPREMGLKLLADDDDLAGFHAKRALLVDRLRPDLTPQTEPVTLVYSGAGKEMEIGARFTQGLAGSLDLEAGVAAASMQAADPFWRERKDEGASLLTGDTLGFAGLLARINGSWTDFGPPSYNAADSVGVYVIAEGLDGTKYIGGRFKDYGGNTKCDHVCKYKDGVFTPLAGGVREDDAVATPQVAAILPLPDGRVVIAGRFAAAKSSAGADVANTACIAIYNPATDSWSALGTGLVRTTNFTGAKALALDSKGRIWCGGGFDSASGVATTRNLAAWDLAAAVPAWKSVGQTNGNVSALAMAPDGTPYVGGTFTSIGGVSVSNVARYRNGAWKSMNGGCDSTVAAIQVAGNTEVYLGGYFAHAGGISANCLAKFTGGGNYERVGDIQTGYAVTSLSYRDGLLYAVGDFNSVEQGPGIDPIGDITPMPYAFVAVWDGASWRPLDIATPNLGNFPCVFAGKDGGVWLGGDRDPATVAPIQIPATNTILCSGSAKSYPVLRMKRTGGTVACVRHLTNETSGEAIILDYYLADGETVEIDFRPKFWSHRPDGLATLGKGIRSSTKGSQLQALRQGSDFASFGLTPGVNEIGVYVYTDATVTADMYWRPRHWSADGAAS